MSSSSSSNETNGNNNDTGAQAGGSQQPPQDNNRPEEQMSLGSMEFRDIYGPPRIDDGDLAPFGSIFSIAEDDIQQVLAAGTFISSTAVFRFTYARVGEHNTGKAEEDFVGLFHPTFVTSFESQEQPASDYIRTLGCFLRPGVSRYLIPVIRDQHFVLVEAGVYKDAVIFICYDSLAGVRIDLNPNLVKFPDTKMFPERTAKKLMPLLFPGMRYGYTCYPVYEIRSQEANDCGIHTVINSEITLSAPFDPYSGAFCLHSEKLDSVATRQKLGSELTAMLLEQEEAQLRIDEVMQVAQALSNSMCLQ